MKKNIFVLLLIIFSLKLNAQTFFFNEKDYRDVLFAQSVKSCDEFICRFNEEEFFPDLDINDPQLGKKNFLMLFDYQLSIDRDKDSFLTDVFQLYDTIRVNKIKLEYESSKWYAELHTEFIYKKNKVELGIVFQPEKTPKDLLCWTIVGVNGLEQVGFTDSIKRMVISPEQHESEFMEIESCFKFYNNQFSEFRSYQSSLDALSYFFALIESGTMIFSKRVSTTFHFFCVPSYWFCVKYHNRMKANNGWLISDFKKVTLKEKALIINNLLTK